MVIGSCTVGRKTAGDGRIEIPVEAAAALGRGSGASIGVRVASPATGADEVAAELEAMPCSCGRMPESGAHVHHFLRAEAFRSLPAGLPLVIERDAEGRVALRPPYEEDRA